MVISLSEQQKKVVNYDGKYLLVIAGAGSGKTRVLTERIRRLILSLKKGEKILAVTFSNKASDELQDRLLQSIGENNLNECAYIGTTHKFCLDLVASRGNLIGLPDDLHICESYNDRLKTLKEAIEANPYFRESNFTNDSKENQRLIRELLDEISFIKRNLGNYADLEDENKAIVFQEYDDMLLKQGIIDFDDILRYAYQILVERESVARIYRRVYKYICVDEAQDLNKAQYEIIKALAGDIISIMMVGDPNQSIYGFNGSTSDYLENNFVRDYKAELITLNENYRSSQKVIEAANVIENSFKAKAVFPIVGEFEMYAFDDDMDEAQFILDRILSLRSTGHPDVENTAISLNQCAVIARNRYVFTHLEDLMKKQNIEYTLKVSAKGSFSSESDLMKAFELGIRLLVNNRDKLHLKELQYLVKNKFDDFNQLTTAQVSDYWKPLINVLVAAWGQLLKSDHEIRFDKALSAIRQYVESNISNFNEHDLLLVIGDIEAWEKNWTGYVRKSAPGERTLGNFVRAVSLGSTYSTDDKGVVLTTVHMSKGLEYDVVFIMGLNEGVFPDYRAVNSYVNNEDEKQLIEERHNMFVAMSRSKRLCYLTYPLVKNTPWGQKNQGASRYIHEIVKTLHVKPIRLTGTD